MKNLIGLSLSACILDILKDRVHISNVNCIVSNTAFLSIEDAITYYTKPGFPWNGINQSVIKDLLVHLWPVILQPRLNDVDNIHSQENGMWINTIGHIHHIIEKGEVDHIIGDDNWHK
jgi:hypothetical protein